MKIYHVEAQKICQKKIALGQKPGDQGEQSPGPTL